MARKEEQPQKWWITLLVAVLPAMVAGFFSLRAIDKANQSSAAADKTASELTVAYDLMKQAMEVVQHEADGNRESLQKTNELLVKLLEQKSTRNHEEVAVLEEAKALNVKLAAPPPLPRPLFPPHVHDLLNQPK